LHKKYVTISKYKKQTGAAPDSRWTLTEAATKDGRAKNYPFTDMDILTLWVEMTKIDSVVGNSVVVVDGGESTGRVDVITPSKRKQPESRAEIVRVSDDDGEDRRRPQQR